MKPIAGSFSSWIRLSHGIRRVVSDRTFFLLLILSSLSWTVSAQTITWSETYQYNVAPTMDQRQRWTDFLLDLQDKNFGSVTLSGSFDQTGVSLNDPCAATELASLLATGTPGTIESNGHAWTVTRCDTGNGVVATALSVDGNPTACNCTDLYALRPHSTTGDWGGINSPSRSSCRAASQSMKLEFHPAVTILTNGSTTICSGESVVLTAQSVVCSGPLTFKWNNGATTASIEVTASGSYSVTVSDANNHYSVSSPVIVSSVEVNVSAGDDALYCGEPVQLNAVGNSVGGEDATATSKICLFDSPTPEGIVGNCSYAVSNNICEEGLTEMLQTTAYTTTTAISNPVELRYVVHYTAYATASVNLKLNGHILESFTDIKPSGSCSIAPKVFTFTPQQLELYWNESANNDLTIEVVGNNQFYVAGLWVELVTSTVSYSWTPSENLSDPMIASPFATPAEPTTYTVTYTDANGCQASDEVTVKPQCEEAPIAVCKPLVIDITEGCEAMVAASDFNNGSSSPTGLPMTYSISPAGPFAAGTTTEVVFTVTDSKANSSSCNTTITVNDIASPVITALPEVVLTNDAGVCSATLPLPQVSDNCGVQSIGSDQPDNVIHIGTTTVIWIATDLHGNKQTFTQIVTLNNDAPVVSSVDASESAVALGTAAFLTINYTDNNISEAIIDWGDASQPTIYATPSSLFEARHDYLVAGTYAVNITLRDLCGASTSFRYESIVVFDPQAGWVKGGGWFQSPAGAYRKDLLAKGRANFSFDAQFNEYSNEPVGSVNFNFKSADFKFRSTALDMLLINGETARLTGSGTVNGKGGYGILVSMVDDETKMPREGKGRPPMLKSDRLRVKIWDAEGVVIYDTQLDDTDGAIANTHIGAGSVEIGTSSSTFSAMSAETLASSFGEESTSVYPNPFMDYVNVQFNSVSTEDIVVQLMDLAGRIVATGVFPVSENGSYFLDVPGNPKKGVYVLSIKQGERLETLNVIRN